MFIGKIPCQEKATWETGGNRMVIKNYEIDYVEFYNDYAIIEFENTKQLKLKVNELLDNNIDFIVDFNTKEQPKLYIKKWLFSENRNLIFKETLIVDRNKLLEGLDEQLQKHLQKFPGGY